MVLQTESGKTVPGRQGARGAGGPVFPKGLTAAVAAACLAGLGRGLGAGRLFA